MNSSAYAAIPEVRLSRTAGTAFLHTRPLQKEKWKQPWSRVGQPQTASRSAQLLNGTRLGENGFHNYCCLMAIFATPPLPTADYLGLVRLEV